MNEFNGKDEDRVLLTEGRSDCYVAKELCANEFKEHLFYLHDCRGLDRVKKLVPLLLKKESPPKFLGIVFDADTRPKYERYSEVVNTIRKLGVALPPQPQSDGVIENITYNESAVRIGIWMMPDNVNCGMLEDFCLGMVQDCDIAYVREVVDKAKDDGLTKFKDAKYAKAVIHTYLSWQLNPGSPLAQGIMSNALDRGAELAQRFQNWMGALFEFPDR